MKLKQATVYALHATMYMVRHITQLPLTAHAIAKAEGMPPGYLAKIFQRLVKANIVKSSANHKKGYVFARPPKEINLLELFEAVEDRPIFQGCFLDHGDCKSEPGKCAIGKCWMDAAKGVTGFLVETSLVAAAWEHPEVCQNS